MRIVLFIVSVFYITLLSPQLGAGEILFVANGYYDQETDIHNHLQTMGFSDITVKKDYKIKGTTDLSSYDFIIVTGFAPNIRYSGIQNILSSGLPVLAVEYWDFIYSRKLGLTSDSFGYFGDNTIEVLDPDHPITDGLSGNIEAYDPSYYSFGVGDWIISPGVTPLLSGPTWGQVTVLVDETRQIAATGLAETGMYSAAAWDLFERLIYYLNPDDDGDGLSDDDEINIYGTDPHDADSDDDGLLDGEEVDYWNSRPDSIGWDDDIELVVEGDDPGDGLINLLDPDSDNDGLLDGEEVHGKEIEINGTLVQVSSDPTVKDTDGDHLSDVIEYDGWEITVKGDVLEVFSDPSSADTDADSLGDFYEWSRKVSSPSNSATYGGAYTDTKLDVLVNKIRGGNDFVPLCDSAGMELEPVHMLNYMVETDIVDDEATYTFEFQFYLPEEKAGQDVTIHISSTDASSSPDNNDRFSDVSVEVVESDTTTNLSSQYGTLDETVTVAGSVYGYINVALTYEFDDNGSAFFIYLSDEDDDPVPLNFAWQRGSMAGESNNHISADIQIAEETPFYLRGGAFSDEDDESNYVDRVEVNGDRLYRRAFNGGAHVFPLFRDDQLLSAGVSFLEFDWKHDGNNTQESLETHLCLMGHEWEPVQITYTHEQHADQYEQWKMGAADERALVRQGAHFYLVIDHPSLLDVDASLSIYKGEFDGDTVTYDTMFSINGVIDPVKVNDYSDQFFAGQHRETYRVEVYPYGTGGSHYTNAKPGFYQIRATADGDIVGTAELVIVYNPFRLENMPQDEIRAYSYDDRGFFFQLDTGPSTTNHVWHLDARTKIVSEMAAAIVHDAMGSHPMQSAALISEFTNSMLHWSAAESLFWDNTFIYHDSVQNIIDYNYITLEEGYNRFVEDPINGQCMDFAAVSAALLRSVGIPARMASGQAAWNFNFHIWNEVFATGSLTDDSDGYWWVYDSTDDIGSPTGYGVDFRNLYGDDGDPILVWAEDAEKTTSPAYIDVTSYY
ncbi:MAG: hypothetical protein GY854_11290 [Deltaproteobacteria bacterium]|nr:hypothetical protein [Deltaproteobacteria bacterium]